MRHRQTYAERQRSFRASAGPTARLICADDPGREQTRQAVGTRRGSTELIQRMLPVLDLDPAIVPAAAVDTLAMLGDLPSSPIRQACRNRSGPIAPCSSRTGRCHRRGAPAVAPSTAADSGDPRRRSPGCRRPRTAPRHRACGKCKPLKSERPSTPSSTASPSRTITYSAQSLCNERDHYQIRKDEGPSERAPSTPA